MSYILYYSPGASSMSVHWMLIELGLEFEAVLVDLRVGAQHAPEYLRINPTGKVPTLVVDGIAHRESTALLMLLAERHPDARMAPAVGTPERADWLEHMIYLAGTIPTMLDWFYADVEGDPAGNDAIRASALRKIEKVWDRLDNRFADGRRYFMGERIGVADFLAIKLMRWSRNMPRPATTWRYLGPYIERARALPSFVEVNNREGLTDWQNAQS